MSVDLARIRADFDQIATFGESGSDWYDRLLISHVPSHAVDVLEVGCGLGRLCRMLARNEPAVRKMAGLLQPGGTLVLHDMRRDAGVVDTVRAYSTLAQQALVRFARSGRLRPPPHVRAAWIRHGQDEHYLSFAEARQLAARLLPGANVFYHSMWRSTIVWLKP